KFAALREPLGQRAATDELHHVTVRLAIEMDVLQSDDAPRLVQAGQQPHFSPRLLIGLLAEPLDGYERSTFQVACLPDVAIRALADVRDNLIALQRRRGQLLADLPL